MYPALGCYGPSLQDQGIGPEDCEEEHRIPTQVTVELNQYAYFFDSKGGMPGNESYPYSDLRRRLTLEEFKAFMEDLGHFYNRWGKDIYAFGWLLRYFFKDVE